MNKILTLYIESVIVDEVSPILSLSVMRMQGTYGEVSVMYYSQNLTDGAISGTDYILASGVSIFLFFFVCEEEGVKSMLIPFTA